MKFIWQCINSKSEIATRLVPKWLGFFSKSWQMNWCKHHQNWPYSTIKVHPNTSNKKPLIHFIQINLFVYAGTLAVGTWLHWGSSYKKCDSIFHQIASCCKFYKKNFFLMQITTTWWNLLVMQPCKEKIIHWRTFIWKKGGGNLLYSVRYLDRCEYMIESRIELIVRCI